MRKLNLFERVLLGVAMALLLFGANGCARGLVLKESSDSVAPAIVVGDARTIASGTASALSLRTIAPGIYSAAYGVATTGDLDGLRTALVFGDCAAGEGGAVALADATVRSPFMVGIPRRVLPTARYEVSGGTALEEVLREIVERHGKFVVIVGAGRFDHIEAERLRTAPTAGATGEALYDRAVRHDGVDAVFVGGLLRGEHVLRGTHQRLHAVEAGRRGLVDELTEVAFALVDSAKAVDLDNPGAACGTLGGAARFRPGTRIGSARINVYSIDELDPR